MDVCHITGTGGFHLINISANAWPAHQAHGDGTPGSPVPGKPGFTFGETCALVLDPPPPPLTFQIDLDGRVDGAGFASKFVAFPAGTYELTPIGIADGGLYDAFDARGNVPNTWEWAYLFARPTLPFNHIWDGQFYATPADALANGLTHGFTLTAPESIAFGVNDCPGCLGDNAGGISIKVVRTAGP
jgi:hypothetical protein